jgi:hypothetical protein
MSGELMIISKPRLWISFLGMFLVASQASCGNQELMERARQKVFLLNKQILEQTNQLPEGNTIEFSGRVKRTADGKLQFTIDELKESTSNGTSKYLVPESLPVGQEGQPVQTSPELQNRKKEYIRYVLFEDMINDSASPPEPAVGSSFKGGGKAISE